MNRIEPNATVPSCTERASDNERKKRDDDTPVVFALFPVVPDTLARLLGIYSTANFLFLFMIFILLMRMFSMSMRISTLEDKIRKLVQELALRDKDARDERTKASAEECGCDRSTRAQDASSSSSRHAEKWMEEINA